MSLSLRRLRLEDGPQVLAWRNAPELGAHMYSDHAIEAAEHGRWLQAALTRKDRGYWIIERDGGAVGLANLIKIDPTAGSCEWAFYLAEPSVRGQGAGLAMAYLMAGHVFDRLGLHELRSEVLAHNAGSLRLHDRLGFTRDALWTAHVLKGDRPVDVVSLRLSERDWVRRKPELEQRVASRFELAGLQIDA